MSKKCVQGVGLSRAAKRRKKKKKEEEKDKVGEGAKSQQSTTLHANQASIDPNKLSTKEPSPPKLVEALQKNPSCGHLRPFVFPLCRPLPLTFRVRSTVPDQQFDEFKQKLKPFAKIINPTSLGAGRIFQSRGIPKDHLSKTSPGLKDLLVSTSMNGTIARQEIGSMLPVLALEQGGWLSESHRVLDMCASPGSKTLQALEVVGLKGKVIANDVNTARVETLKEAVFRSGLQKGLTDRVTWRNHDASVFPTPKNLYDAIICDVPCSGDGTIRKDKHILPMWTPAIGNELHNLQLKILVRAVQLLKPGGVVCYSTCSLNPVEDEAVVAAALAQVNQSEQMGELVDFPQIAGLVRRKGLTTWRVADFTGDDDDDDDFSPKLQWYNFAADSGNSNLHPSLWPPRSASFGLSRCTRLWPQDQDTGGFFLAIIRRVQHGKTISQRINFANAR